MNGKIAIVGAGPSGCYVAQALLKSEPALQVDVIDALPVPYGLVRYGVAADHQGTKAVVRQFARIFERQGARFFGNVRIGLDVSLNDLRQAYDVVVIAAGLSLDKKLGVEGEELPGVYGSASLAMALHEHPDAGALPVLGANPIIVGNGNVAIDLVRMLCKTRDEFDGSDLGAIPTAWLERNEFETITILGRSAASRAKFDALMLRELGKLGNVQIDVIGADHSDEPDERKRLDALADINGHASGKSRVIFRFGLTPVAVEGREHVTGLRVSGTNGTETIPASSIITAIGFADDGALGHDELKAAALDLEAGKLADGLFCVGWFRAGPRGAIPDSRLDAQAVAHKIIDDLAVDLGRIGGELFEGLPGVVGFDGWQNIDAHETSTALPNRSRKKLPTRTELLRVAKQELN